MREQAPAAERSTDEPATASRQGPAPEGPGSLLRLQRSAGNAAVVRSLSRRGLLRKPLSDVEKAQDLQSDRYGGYPELEDAYDNRPVLKRGPGTSPFVAMVQQGLIDAGFPPASAMSAGMTTGVFDADTEHAVQRFQDRHHLTRDGQVGRQTLGKLDELAVAGPSRKPEIANTEAAMGAHVAKGMADANTGATATSGIYYDYNYFAAHQNDPDHYPWKDTWRAGLASEEYFDRIDWMDWRLKPGKSASDGIRAWLRGLTIAECLTTIVAIQSDTLRAAIGDDAFDARFGSTTVKIPDKDRLRIQPGRAGTVIAGKLKRNEAAVADPGPVGDRKLQVGDWTYFYNHPKYLLKHPGGAWQGENAVYQGRNAAGEQLFSGLGATDKTEGAMHLEMVGAYNRARDGADYVALLRRFAADAPEVRSPSREFLDQDDDYCRGLYEKYIDRIPDIYREDSGEFADEVTLPEITSAPAYTIDKQERLGGLRAASIQRLDPDIVGLMRMGP